jgi:TATA-box binding protein (TBP) (component of TFIID and TFIIIB)
MFFKNYIPIYDETEFDDEKYLVPRKSYPKPGKVSRSMATVLTSLGQKVNTDILNKFLKHSEIKLKTVKFFNQATMVINVPIKGGLSRDINMKIFGKGTVHMTGGHSIKECKRALAILLKIIKTFKVRVHVTQLQPDKPVPPKYIYCVNDTDIDIETLEIRYRLSNRPFCTNFEFSICELYDIFKTKIEQVSYNPNRFAGLRYTKFINGSRMTYLVFKSGKITISVTDDTSIIPDAYKYFNQLLKTNYDRLVEDRYRCKDCVVGSRKKCSTCDQQL